MNSAFALLGVEIDGIVDIKLQAGLAVVFNSQQMEILSERSESHLLMKMRVGNVWPSPTHPLLTLQRIFSMQGRVILYLMEALSTGKVIYRCVDFTSLEVVDTGISMKVITTAELDVPPQQAHRLIESMTLKAMEL